MTKRNKYAKALWEDKRYMQRVCKNKKERKEYEKVLKRMDQEAEEVMRGYIEQYEKD